MVSEELRELLVPQIKLHLLDSDEKYIDYMLGEVYLIKEDGMDMIVIKPLPSAFATMKFFAVNGAFAGDVINWEEVKMKGTRL